MKPQLAVIHLVWLHAGFDAFQRFISSYTSRRPGVKHRLILVFKEFPGEDIGNYESLIRNVPHERAFIPQPCFDIPAYIGMARQVDSQHLCLLNSNSEILCDNWLEMLMDACSAKGVGAAGATGSWESAFTSQIDLLRQNATERRFASWDAVRRSTSALAAMYPPFPNFHLRTNAVLIRRETLISVQFPWQTRDKSECLLFESGWIGLTSQLSQNGLRPIVVGRDGRHYEKQDWPESNTFRSGNQDNLMISDNRTRDYECADREKRNKLSFLAWGKKAGQ